MIFIIIDQLMKIIYYKLIMIIIDASSLISLSINIIIKYYNLLNLIITNEKILFTSKF